MGSEHYCLRWNNHQSNLLGVFSQLLQDESLVDVTLACSEGAPIRAHKVVLSACSSYFQSLFLDHPEKHPIVILKDVRFAELQTLVEFMYKGEVNVQYCQLSALLKTAESLKVKGLAEMTNQNTTLREPEREPERLRPHSQPCKRSNSCDSPVDATLSGPSTSAATTAAAISSAQHAAALAAASAAGLTTASISSNAASSISATTNATSCTIASSATSLISTTSYSIGSSQQQHPSSVSSKREHASERCSPSPPKRLHAKHDQDSPLPLDLYQRRLEHQQQEDTKENSIVNNNNTNEKHKSTTPQTTSGTTQKQSNSSESGGGGGGGGGNAEGIKKRDDLERDSIRSFNSPERLARHDVNRPLEETIGVEGTSTSSGIDKIDDVEDVEYGDEEMELDDDGDNNSEDVCLNMKIRSSSLAAALVSPQLTSHRGLESSGHGGGIGGNIGEGGADSARSTPMATTLPLAFDTHSQHRPASRSSREGTGLDRPSSRGGLIGLPSTSASGLAGSLSPVSTSAAALGLHSDSVPGSSVLGPVQSVPLSLKKEFDCSEDDNSNSRHHLQPRSASAGGVLGGDLEYRTAHESETSDSPHGLSGIATASGGSGSGSGGGGGLSGSSTATTGNTAPSYVHEQPQTPPPYTCLYCGAGFPNQNKLTRHILSHSLKTLEYRETTTHPLLHPHLLAHDLNMSPLAYQMNAAMASAGADAQEQAAAVAAAVAMDMDFAAAIAAAGGCPFPSLASCTTRGVDLDGSGGGGGGSSSSSRGARDGGGGGGGSSSASGNGGCPSSSFSLLSSAGSSTSAAAAAAVAAAAASSSASSNDPNSVVLCKFCGKSFPDVTSLITHLPIHTGDRPFKCEFCGKAFKLRHHMKDHCRVHTGERPFRCQMCGKTFSRSTILKAHEKTHFPKYARKFLSPSPVDTKDELPQ